MRTVLVLAVTALATVSAYIASNPSNPVKKVTLDGCCGGKKGHACHGSVFGNCCSAKGLCGKTAAHCNTGCNSALGTFSSSTAPVAVKVSHNARCGYQYGALGGYNCKDSTFGDCCSKYGYCGNAREYCGGGCQPGYGKCGITPSYNQATSKPSTSTRCSSTTRSSSFRVYGASRLPVALSSSVTSTPSVSASASASTSATPTPDTADCPTNFLTNSDFEAGWTGWTAQALPRGSVSYQLKSEAAHARNSGIVVSESSDVDAGITIRQDNAEAADGIAVSFTVWVKSFALPGAVSILLYLDNDLVGSATPIDNDWVQVIANAHIGGFTHVVRVVVQFITLDGGSGNRAVYLYDFAMTAPCPVPEGGVGR